MCQSVHNHSNASIKRHDKLTVLANTSHQMFNVFAFGFDTQIKTISPLIKCMINDALFDAVNSCMQRFFPDALFLLSTKSLTASMFSAVCDVRGVPLPGCRSVVLISQFLKKIIQTAQVPSLLWKLLN